MRIARILLGGLLAFAAMLVGLVGYDHSRRAPYVDYRALGERVLPVLGGPALPGDGAEHYDGVVCVNSDAVAGLSPDPAAPVPTATLAALADPWTADAVARLRSGSRCAHVRWGRRMPDSYDIKGPYHADRRGGADSARLFVALGHLAGQRHDAPEQVSWYLDALRFATDVATGDVANHLEGCAGAAFALDALSALVANPRVDRARIRERLEAIEPFLPDAARAIHWEWIERQRYSGKTIPLVQEAYESSLAFLLRAEAVAREGDRAALPALAAERRAIPRIPSFEDVADAPLAIEQALLVREKHAALRAKLAGGGR